MEKVKGFEAWIDQKGIVTCDKKEYKEFDIPSLIEELDKRKDNYGKCYLFFFKDVPGRGSVNFRTLNSSREDFESEPEKFGICLFKTWNGRAIWE